MSDRIRSLKVFTDGASRGNPGDAAWGYLILDEDENLITQQSGYVGRSTNNQAEYLAVIRALQRASEITDGEIDLRSDSQLMVKQVTGEWEVRDPELARLHRRVKAVAEGFEEVSFTHVPRENDYVARADQLCNDRLDEIQ